MDDTERLNLQKMISANNVEDCTESIRSKKHSKKIRDDVTRIIDLKKKYPRLSKQNPQQFDAMLVSQCNFLFNNYTDIFNKVKKEEIDLKILWDFLNVLESIEEGKIDQHEGAYEVGKLLKSIYIDSALRKADKMDKKTGKKIPAKPVKEKKISWRDFKKMQENQN